MDSGLAPYGAPRNDKSGRCASATRALELNTRRGFDLGSAGAEVEEILSRKAEHAGKQRRGHLLYAGVVFLDGVVEEAAARGDLVFEIGQFTRELLEIGVGLEVGIGFRERDQPPQRA